MRSRCIELLDLLEVKVGVLTKKEHEELSNELCDIDMEIAKGQDTPELDARATFIEKKLDGSPWMINPDTGKAVLLSEI